MTRIRGIRAAGPGATAHMQFWILRLVATLLRPVHGRGLATIVSQLAKLFPHRNYVVLELAHGGVVKVDLWDAYWIAPLLRGTYEPEVQYVLGRLLQSDDAFIDCGANIGYWSVFAASRIRRRARVVAIEPSRIVFERLKENVVLNARPIQCIHAAIWDAAGATIELAVDETKHSWASADPETVTLLRTSGFRAERVATTTIDQVLDQEIDGNPRLLIVKVDIEGGEEAAFAGGATAFERNTLFVYEEHGRSDVTPLTESLLARDGVAVFFCDESTCVRQLHDVKAVRAIKKEPSRGYNFFACNSGAAVHAWMTSLTRD